MLRTLHELAELERIALQNERVLFHYNGHGVPRPTVNGEVWVFNKSYTQYIPMSIYDLQSWVGSPCIYVLDCSAAGLLVNSFRSFAEQRAQVCLTTQHCNCSEHGSVQAMALPLSSCMLLKVMLAMLGATGSPAGI